MKLRVAIFCLITAVAAAEEPRLEILGLADKQTAFTPPASHVFGGQPVKIDLSLEAPLGSKLEARADLIQKAQSLTAPLQKDIVVAEAISFAGQTRCRITASLPLPKVQRETQIIARFRLKAKGEWRPASEMIFVVYPPDFLKGELQDIAGATRLHLFGDDKRLRDFLNGQEVKFDEIGAEFPENPETNQVYAGCAGAKELSQWLAAHATWQGSLLVFCEDSNLLPGVFIDSRRERRLAKVTLPLLDNLSSDPRSQKTLTEIFNNIIPRQTP